MHYDYQDVTRAVTIGENEKIIFCKLSINSEEKIIQFEQDSERQKVYHSPFVVYVSVSEIPPIDTPQYGPRYTNRVRSTFLQITRKRTHYYLSKCYRVLNNNAFIVSWVDSKWGEHYARYKAKDHNIPMPKW